MNDFVISKKDCLFKNLKIPESFRIVEDYELLKEIRTNKKLKRIMVNGYVFAETIHGVRLVRLGYVNLYLDAFDQCSGDWRARGVFVKKSKGR